MGRFGSGRRSSICKSTTDDLYKLDIRELNRLGLLVPGNTVDFEWRKRGKVSANMKSVVSADMVTLKYQYRVKDDWLDIEYPIHFCYSDCHFGGTRIWFQCPGASCNRRVAILYAGNYALCRHCNNLAYASQNEKDYERYLRKADKIRERFGWGRGVLNPVGRKPKGMHMRTFLRLHDEYLRWADYGLSEAIGGIALSLDKVPYYMNVPKSR